MENIYNIDISAAYDCPDERDYSAELIEQGGGTYPNEILLLNTSFQNQGNSMACSCFTAGHLGTELDRMDTMKFYDGFNLWEEAKKRGASDTDGWNNTRALKMMKDLGIIGGWAVAKGVDGLIQAFSNGRAAFLGTNKCDWRKTGETGTFSYTENGAGHFFMGCGYNLEKKVMYAKNSWGKEWGPKGGIFEIPFDMINHLFTLYVVYDNKTSLIDNYKKMIRDDINIENAKIAFDNDIWGGTEPTKGASREEVAAMIMRGLEKLSKLEIKFK